MTTWYRAIRPSYLTDLRQDRTLTIRQLATCAGVDPAFAHRVLSGNASCRHSIALSLTRILTGNPDAQEVGALFVAVLRAPSPSTSDRPQSGKSAMDEVPA